MAATKIAKTFDDFDDSELKGIAEIMLKSVNTSRKNKTRAGLAFMHSFSSLLEELMELNLVDSKVAKLKLIDFIDKLNVRRELHEIESGAVDLNEVQKAGRHLQQKAQSSFNDKEEE